MGIPHGNTSEFVEAELSCAPSAVESVNMVHLQLVLYHWMFPLGTPKTLRLEPWSKQLMLYRTASRPKVHSMDLRIGFRSTPAPQFPRFLLFGNLRLCRVSFGRKLT